MGKVYEVRTNLVEHESMSTRMSLYTKVCEPKVVLDTDLK